MGAEALTTNILLLRVINRTLYDSQAEEMHDSINPRDGTIKRRVFAGS
jgi:hypothetical protein